jgi:hypothetical protein
MLNVFASIDVCKTLSAGTWKKQMLRRQEEFLISSNYLKQ